MKSNKLFFNSAFSVFSAFDINFVSKLFFFLLFLFFFIFFFSYFSLSISSSNSSLSSSSVDSFADFNSSFNSSSNSSENTSNNFSISYELSLDTRIPEITYINLLYDDLFKIKNLDHVSGEKENLEVKVIYWIYNNSGVVILNSSFQLKGMNSYKTSGTGEFQLSREGNYTLCGRIVESFYNGDLNNDSNKDNDFACFNFTAIDSSKIPCNVSLDLEISKFIVNNSEQIKIKNIISDEKYPYIIEYRVKDVFGDLLRLKTTENDNDKVFTPKINSRLEAYYVENELLFVACNNSERAVSNKKLLLVLNRNYDPSLDSFCSSSSSSNSDSNNNDNNNDNINNSASSLSSLGDESIIRLEKIYGNAHYFGSPLRVKFYVYKGDSRKSSIKLFVMDKDGSKVSFVSSNNVNKKFTESSFTSYLLLKDTASFEEGKYFLVIEGLDQVVKQNIWLSRKSVKETNLTVVEKENVVPEIKSFYTRNRKFVDDGQEINLYANIVLPNKLVLPNKVSITNDSLNNKDSPLNNYYLTLYSKDYLESFPITNNVSIHKFSTRIYRGINSLLLLLRSSDKKIVDVKELYLFVENSSIIIIKSFDEVNSFSSNNLSVGDSNFVDGSGLKINKFNSVSNVKGAGNIVNDSLITSKVVFVGKNSSLMFDSSTFNSSMFNMFNINNSNFYSKYFHSKKLYSKNNYSFLFICLFLVLLLFLVLFFFKKDSYA